MQHDEGPPAPQPPCRCTEAVHHDVEDVPHCATPAQGDQWHDMQRHPAKGLQGWPPAMLLATQRPQATPCAPQRSLE
eukprot:15238599-Alexandrium_andersonii.AAC.1